MLATVEQKGGTALMPSSELAPMTLTFVQRMRPLQSLPSAKGKSKKKDQGPLGIEIKCDYCQCVRVLPFGCPIRAARAARLDAT